MINTRSLVISISWVLLSATPLVYAQDVKSSEAQLSLQHPAIIQELRLQPIRFFSFPLQADPWAPSWAALSAAPLMGAQDVKTSEPKLSLQRPAIIQELQVGAFDVLDVLCDLPKAAEAARRALGTAYLKRFRRPPEAV
jgi:hypothetical protein